MVYLNANVLLFVRVHLHHHHPIVLRPFQFGLGFPYNWCPFLPLQCFRSPLFHTKLPNSSSTSFIHLSLGRPLLLLPSNFPSKIFFTDLVSFILITCPSHSNLRIFITFTISWDLYLMICIYAEVILKSTQHNTYQLLYIYAVYLLMMGYRYARNM